MKQPYLCIFLFALLLLSFSTKAQINKELKGELQKSLSDKEKKILDKADKYYLNQDYLYALSLYDSLYKKHNDNIYLGYLLGTVQSYDPLFFDRSEALIKSAETIRTKLFDYDFYLGKALENNDKFDEAVKQYETYLQNPIPDTLKIIVKHQIEICKNSAAQIKRGSLASATNIGPVVNTEAAEYSPALPTTEKYMVYTYRGPKSKGGKQKIPGKPDEKGTYFEDVYITYKNDSGQWQKPQPIDAINTVGHDAVMSISHDGQKLYIFRNVGVGNGDIFVSYLKGTQWSPPEKVKGINSNFWEGSICFSPDEKYLYFSSERPGGVGGRDIWIAERLADGSYGKVQNMSLVINTPYDEDAPFITADGKTMFFSSTGHNSTGGYDVFRSDFKSGKWSEPYNIGKPVNTNQDDKYYWVSADGERGFYSSERKDGYGSQDIILVEPGMFGKPTALIMLNGIVYLDDKPVEASVRIKSKFLKKDFMGTFNSNSVTGEYLINLPAGNEFEVIFTAKNVSIKKSISTVGIDSFAPLRSDANLYTPEFLAALKAKMDSAQAKLDDLARLNMTYQEFLDKYGKVTADSVYFKVQIGAYRYVENFNYRKLMTLPPVRRQIYDDKITRFTIGDLSTISEADSLCKKAIRAGLKDAFVIVIYKNRRITLYDFVKGNYKK
ncbi:MAG TPA: hypothetical protein VNZ49_14355 [Bacteroidia bacterium]|jgi:hypothetical protein|nr:hypothetical protein [Bacteroidia bacterium]